MPHPQFARNEAGKRPWRFERLLKGHERPEINLRRNAAWIFELQVLDHAPRARLLRSRRRDLNSVGPQPRGDFVERRLVADLPSDERQIVSSARLQDEPMVILVHPQERRAVRVGAIDFQAEHVGCEVFPSSKIADADAQVAQLCHTRHRSSPWPGAVSFTMPAPGRVGTIVLREAARRRPPSSWSIARANLERPPLLFSVGAITAEPRGYRRRDRPRP